jgi:hypothetical protein
MANNRRPVGTLDDPIWNEQPETQLSGSHKKAHGSRVAALVVSLVVVIGLGFLGYWLVQPDHPGGDPGGSIMQSLRQPLQSAVPLGAHVAGVSYQEPQWTDGCRWSVVFASLHFTTTGTEAAVISHADAYLVDHGWRRVNYPGIGGPTTWTLGATNGPVKRIDLAAHRGTAGGEYSLTAAAPPLGRHSGC